MTHMDNSARAYIGEMLTALFRSAAAFPIAFGKQVLTALRESREQQATRLIARYRHLSEAAEGFYLYEQSVRNGDTRERLSPQWRAQEILAFGQRIMGGRTAPAGSDHPAKRITAPSHALSSLRRSRRAPSGPRSSPA